MSMHYHGYNVADGGSRTACGVYSPPERRNGTLGMVYPIPQTTDLSKVTCKRCWKSEEFRLANARVGKPLDAVR